VQLVLVLCASAAPLRTAAQHVVLFGVLYASTWRAGTNDADTRRMCLGPADGADSLCMCVGLGLCIAIAVHLVLILCV
jgi:hypothetical protein